jgi:hypothetical protein
VDILRGLADEPANCMTVASRHGLSPCWARRLLRRMRDLGIVSIATWGRCGLRNSLAPVYTYPPQADVPRPLCRSTGQPSRHPSVLMTRVKTSPEVTTLAAILRALSEPIGVRGLSEAVGIHYNSALALIRHAHQIGFLFIADWERRLHGGKPSALYQVGIGRKDAPRPVPEPKHLGHKRYRLARAQKLQQLAMLHAIAANGQALQRAA